jgi:AraC-like DNA-binding protein
MDFSTLSEPAKKLTRYRYLAVPDTPSQLEAYGMTLFEAEQAEQIDAIGRRRATLAKLIERFAPEYGVHPTAIDALHLIRSDHPTDIIHTVHKPGLCIIVQGAKQIHLGEECYRYDPLNYLVVSVTLPLAGQVIEATADEPYLCIRLDIEPADIAQLVSDASPIGVPDKPAERGLFLDQIDTSILDAMLRLLRLLETPDDIAILAPMAIREIYYRLLRGAQGHRLYEVALADSQTQRVARAIDWLNTHFAEPLRIEELARRVNLSSSALHHRFKAVTAMSPLQYQKHLRLNEAHRLMLSEGLDVTSTCYRVGYESLSQFSREYSRFFGVSPTKHLNQLRIRA